MAKYKVGDKVQIVSQLPDSSISCLAIPHLGKTVTVKSVSQYWMPIYRFEEAYEEFKGRRLYPWFTEKLIDGLAQPAVKDDSDLSVVIRFCGERTVAQLMRGETIVKTATARRNPADKYSRAEGAKIAVERLFEKKRKEDKAKESKPKIGDKFVVTGNSATPHFFTIGEIVTRTHFYRAGVHRYKGADGASWLVSDCDVVPYKGEHK